MALQPFIQLIRHLKTGVIRPVLLTSPVTMSLFDQAVSSAMMMTEHCCFAVDGRDDGDGQPLARTLCTWLTRRRWFQWMRSRGVKKRSRTSPTWFSI